MYNQMEQFEEGGLKDEGGTVDEVSGNEVPVGGTKKGVRDDIPAMVSEGEFIFPEDVTRYIGLDKLMQLRQDAKMGLKKMEAMGQMGNGDEATMEDDMPFEMADLIIVGGPMEEPQEKYKGGVLHAQQGTYVGQQQPATGIAGYQPSMYANRAPINPYQYQAPASAFTPPTYQNTQVAPSQPTSGYMPKFVGQGVTTSGYMPKFVGQGVTRKTVTGRETPRVEAEQFVEDIYLDVKYINRETGDIRTFKFYQGEPISEIPAGYVPYEEGQDPATGTPPPEGDVAPTTAQVSRGSDDDDRGPPPPPPFNWDEATPEAIVNEVNKIQGPAGSVMTGLAAVLNPALGAMVYAATKANEKQTLTKLDELLKDKAFVKKMSDAGQLKKLKDSLNGLEEKTKGAGKGTVDIDLLGILGSAVKGVAKALGLTPEEEKKVIKNSVSDAAGIAPPKKPEQEGEEPTITITQPDPVDDMVAGEDLFAYDPETTSVLENTSVLGDTFNTYLDDGSRNPLLDPTRPFGVAGRYTPPAQRSDVSGVRGTEEGLFSYAPLAPISVDRISELIGNIDTTDPVKLSESIISMSKDVAQPSRPLEDLPSAEQGSADPLTMAQAAMKAMTQSSKDQRKQVYDPEFLETPVVTAPTPAYTQPSQDPYAEPNRPTGGGSDDSGGYTPPTYSQPSQDPYAEAGRPTSSSNDDGPSAAQIAASANDNQASAYEAMGGSYSTPSTTYSTDSSTAIQQMKDRGTFNVGGRAKGGFISKPKKKASSKKRGLAARK